MGLEKDGDGMSDEIEYYELLNAFEEEQEEVEKLNDRLADLEAQLTEAQRREGLLRAVAEKAEWAVNKGGQSFCPLCHESKWNGHHEHCEYREAIDGGALGE